MTMVATPFASVFSSVVFSGGAIARRLAAAIGSWLQARRDYRMLCGMNDCELRDIGLTRCDLRDATAVGHFDDRTSIIASRSFERRGRRRSS